MKLGLSNFESPRGRQSILKQIPPIREVAEEYHADLLEIFRRETAYQDHEEQIVSSTESGLEFFENLYWCAFLLFVIGDVNDVPQLWRAKNLNMDIGCGMEWQFLVGAGTEQTVEFALRNDLGDLAAYLRGCAAEGDSTVLQWALYRCYYFYGRRNLSQ